MSFIVKQRRCPRPRHLPDQHFAMALTSDDVLTVVNPSSPNLHSNWTHPSTSLGSTIKIDRNAFQMNLDVQHFAPEEITVKTVGGFVVIEGRHEEKEDEHGFVSREFTRRYALPEGCDVSLVESRLSSDGVLTILAPLSTSTYERVVPVRWTGPVRTEEEVELDNRELESPSPGADGEQARCQVAEDV